MIRSLAVILVLAGLCAPARAYTCEDVDRYRAQIELMPREVKLAWIKALKLTKREVRAARRCPK